MAKRTKYQKIFQEELKKEMKKVPKRSITVKTRKKRDVQAAFKRAAKNAKKRYSK